MINLRRIRKERRVSQNDLAQSIGVTQGTVSNWETGHMMPTLENLIAIAKFFGCKVDDLIDK